MHNESVERFLADGCGRCEHFQTPQCKVHRWTEELVELRGILGATQLEETMKWGSPCYTLDGKNVVMLTAMREWCGLSFFKGSLIPDEAGRLVAPGKNSQAARTLRFTSRREVRAERAMTMDYLERAIEIERSGARVKFAASPGDLPAELERVLDGDAELRSAWGRLTPGRQRSHILHVSGAKQAKTRTSRAAKSRPKILAGKGFNER